MLNITHYQRNANQNHNEYHLMLVRMAAIQKSTNNKCWRGCGEKGSLLCCWWECKLVQPLWRTMWRFLKKTGNRIAMWPSNPTAGHTQQGNQNWNMCTPMFITTLFTIGWTWKQPKCPSAEEWIKMWCMYNGILLSHKNEWNWVIYFSEIELQEMLIYFWD